MRDISEVCQGIHIHVSGWGREGGHPLMGVAGTMGGASHGNGSPWGVRLLRQSSAQRFPQDKNPIRKIDLV